LQAGITTHTGDTAAGEGRNLRNIEENKPERNEHVLSKPTSTRKNLKTTETSSVPLVLARGFGLDKASSRSRYKTGAVFATTPAIRTSPSGVCCPTVLRVTMIQ
jgi:hypothetical protein